MLILIQQLLFSKAFYHLIQLIERDDEDEDGKRTRVKEFIPTKGPVLPIGLQLVAHSLTEATNCKDK